MQSWSLFVDNFVVLIIFPKNNCPQKVTKLCGKKNSYGPTGPYKQERFPLIYFSRQSEGRSGARNSIQKKQK